MIVEYSLTCIITITQVKAAITAIFSYAIMEGNSDKIFYQIIAMLSNFINLYKHHINI